MSLVRDLGADPAWRFKRSTFGAAASDCVVAVSDPRDHPSHRKSLESQAFRDVQCAKSHYVRS
jgi:hypothetical protein